MHEGQETCAHCLVEVDPSQARTARYTLEHMTSDQRMCMIDMMSWGEVPAPLCASCLLPILSMVNQSLGHPPV